jgi:energy-coupling factor transport system permease protein
MASQALFGRYWEADSVIHRLDPRTKFIGVICVMVIAFSAGNFPALGVVAVFALALLRVPRAALFQRFAPYLYHALTAAALTLWLVKGGGAPCAAS